MLTKTTTASTTCSGCSVDLKVNLQGSLVTASIPHNGRRGLDAVKASKPTAEWYWIEDDALIGWDCPACGYADSLDLND